MDGEDLDVSEILEISVEFLKYKSTEVLMELAELIPVDLTDRQNRTLLHWAAVNSQVQKARFLIEQNLTEKNIKDLGGYNCLELACKKANKTMVDYLKSLGMICSLQLGKGIMMEFNQTVEDKITACMYADNSLELQVVLRNVINLNGFLCIPEYFEWTLLGLSAFFLSPKCMKVLIDLGCEPCIQEGDLCTPFDNVLNAVISVLPPENEEEYIELNSGIDCLDILLTKVKDIKPYKNRLQTVFTKIGFVGKGSSLAHSNYEGSVERKALGLRLALSQILS